MANLLRARGYGTVQPPTGAQVDWGHPLAQGLVAGLVLNESVGSSGTDLVGKHWSSGGNIPNLGRGGVTFAGATNDRILVPSVSVSTPGSATVNTTGRFSMDALIWYSATTQNGCYVHAGAWTGTADTRNPGLGVGIGAGDVDSAGSNLVGLNDNVAWLASGVAVPKNQWVHIGATFNATAYVLYLNGIAVLSGTTSLSGIDNYYPELTIGGDKLISPRVPNGGRVATARLWDKRKLSASDMQWLAAEPYAFIAPPGPKILYFAMGGPTPPRGWSDSVEAAILDHYTGRQAYTPPGTWYAAAGTAGPSADTGVGFTEPSGGGYARVALTASTWNAATGGGPSSTSYGSSITFPVSTGSWGQVTHAGMFTASSGGIAQAWGTLSSAVSIDTADQLVVPQLRVKLGDPPE